MAYGPRLKAQGQRGEVLHTLFDTTMVDFEIEEHLPPKNICSSGDNSTNLEHVIWECIYADALPDNADLENVKVLCSTCDKVNYSEEISDIFIKICSGWIPE